MKNLFVLLLLIFSAVGVSYAYPTNTTRGGFYEETTKIIKVADALKMKNDTYVTIQGNIVKRLSEDTYLFKDSTGTITVEINHNKWMGQNVNTKDKLEISGEIERNFTTVKLDVDNLRKLNK